MKFWLGVMAASVAAVPLSAQSAADLTRWGKDVARTAVAPRAPLPNFAPGCAVGAPAGGDASEGIIGEKRGAEEYGAGQQGPQVLANRWQSDRYTSFRHMIEGPPGRVNLVLDACTSASGGETVAVYPVDRRGVRKTPRIMFVIATLRGNARSASLVLPKPPRGQRISKMPIMVVVENASGRPHTGAYRLTVTR